MINEEWYSSQHQWGHTVFPAKRLTRHIDHQQPHSAGSVTISASTATFQGGTGSQIVGTSCGIEKKSIFLEITFSFLPSDNSSLGVMQLHVALHRWLQKSSSGFLCWIAGRRFPPDVFNQTLFWKVFHLHCMKCPVYQGADSHTVDLQPLNIQKVLAGCSGKKNTNLQYRVLEKWWQFGVWSLWGAACAYVAFCSLVCSLLLPILFSNMGVLMSAQVQGDIFECWIRCQSPHSPYISASSIAQWLLRKRLEKHRCTCWTFPPRCLTYRIRNISKIPLQPGHAG